MRRRVTRAYTGKPSVLVAVALLGTLAFFHFKKQGRFDNVDFEKSAQVIEKVKPKEKVKPVKSIVEDPSYAKTIVNAQAYDFIGSGRRQVGVIEANTGLNVLEVRRDQSGFITWVKVRSNGLAVWVMASKLKLS